MPLKGLDRLFCVPRPSRRLSETKMRKIVWLVLTLPWTVMTLRYLSGAAVYGEFLHQTGDAAAWLLLLTLAVTPLRRIFPKTKWTAFLVRNRRSLGVASFGYAFAHTVAYLVRKQELQYILADAAQAGMWTGWFAFAIFAALAATSNDGAVRLLGRKWTTLHKFVYLAAPLTFAHWALTVFDPATAYLHIGLLAVILIARAATARRTHVPSRP